MLAINGKKTIPFRDTKKSIPKNLRSIQNWLGDDHDVEPHLGTNNDRSNAFNNYHNNHSHNNNNIKSRNNNDNDNSVSGPSWKLICESSDDEDDRSDDDNTLERESSAIINYHDLVDSAEQHVKNKQGIYSPSSSSFITQNNMMNSSTRSTPQQPPRIRKAAHNTIVVANAQISEPWAAYLYSAFDSFNAVQSACFNIAACTDENMCVSAPTGCGKTVLFEFAILRLLNTQKYQNAKVVLLCPIRALCQERVMDWSFRFGKLGVKVVELSGDVGKPDIKEVTAAQIICTTPEKWDSITRRWTEHIYLLGKVQLLLVDEIHNIGDSRGATMEAVICRMKSVAKSAAVIKYKLPSADLRIIGLSATLPNLNCIGDFIEAQPQNILSFDSTFRPVSLTVHVHGYPTQSSDFWFEKSLEKKVSEVINQYSAGKPALIFCGSRKSTESTCELICKTMKHHQKKDQSLFDASQRVGSTKLRETLIYGVAFHHANLQPLDRSIVEGLYRDRKIAALCCTSSLAVGVNLPAHLVVIKSTAQWQGKASGYCQMSNSSILQMIGRAGRPGLDDSGVAVIMTDENHRVHYEKISQGCEIVESKLHDELVEILNAEIGNRVIQSIEDAANWIQGTFLFTRLKKNPSIYGLKLPAATTSAHNIDSLVLSFLHEKIRIALHELSSSSIILLAEGGIVISPLNPSHIMSRQMLQLDTMKNILNINHDANIETVLRSLSIIIELSHELRHGQKKLLKVLNTSVRFGLPKSKKFEVQDKMFVLFQGILGRIHMEDQTMLREQNSMAENAGRVLTAVIDHGLESNFGAMVLSATVLRRNFRQRLWENNVSELYQFEDLPEGVVRKLTTFGFSTFGGIAEASPIAIENCVGRRAPFGAKLVQSSRRILSQSLCVVLKVIHTGSDNIPNPNNLGPKNDVIQCINVEIVNKHQYSAMNKDISVQEKVMYILIIFSKKPIKRLFDQKSKVTHGLHLFRSVSEPCTIMLPESATKAALESPLAVALIATKVGLDDHSTLILPGVTPPEDDGDCCGTRLKSKSENPEIAQESKTTATLNNENVTLKSEKTSVSKQHILSKNTLQDDDGVGLSYGKSSAVGSYPILDIWADSQGTCTEKNKEASSPSSNFLKSPIGSIKNSFQQKFEEIDEFKYSDSKLSGSTKVNPKGGTKIYGNDGVSNPSSAHKIPLSSGLSRKSTDRVRDIRDGLKGTLGTLRQKAHETHLLQTVRSSRLATHPSCSPSRVKRNISEDFNNNTDIAQNNSSSISPTPKFKHQYQHPLFPPSSQPQHFVDRTSIGGTAAELSSSPQDMALFSSPPKVFENHKPTSSTSLFFKPKDDSGPRSSRGESTEPHSTTSGQLDLGNYQFQFHQNGLPQQQSNFIQPYEESNKQDMVSSHAKRTEVARGNPTRISSNSNPNNGTDAFQLITNTRNNLKREKSNIKHTPVFPITTKSKRGQNLLSTSSDNYQAKKGRFGNSKNVAEVGMVRNTQQGFRRSNLEKASSKINFDVFF